MDTSEKYYEDTLATPAVSDGGRADKTENRMTGEVNSGNVTLLDLTRSVAGRYRRLAEHSGMLEDAQLRLIRMMESGTVGMDVFSLASAEPRQHPFRLDAGKHD